MLRILNLLVFSGVLVTSCYSQDASLVDYSAYEKLVEQVKSHREKRMVPLHEFLEMSKNNDVIILDTRSKEMYDAKHVKGAVHLNFSDFTQQNLAEVIASKNTKVLIYCNNNFRNDQTFFATKEVVISPTITDLGGSGGLAESTEEKTFGITMALNIPTYINLFGYGYKNVYELSELISVTDPRIEFEGTEVLK